jgi:hypothetical protein
MSLPSVGTCLPDCTTVSLRTCLSSHSTTVSLHACLSSQHNCLPLYLSQFTQHNRLPSCLSQFTAQLSPFILVSVHSINSYNAINRTILPANHGNLEKNVSVPSVNGDTELVI